MTAALIQQYQQQGFILLKDYFPINEIESIKNQTKQAFQNVFQSQLNTTKWSDEAFNSNIISLFKTDFASFHGAAKLANHIPSLHLLSLRHSLIEILKVLSIQSPVICARPLMWFHSPLVSKTERYHRLPAHQEWSNMQGSLNGIVAWSPLLEIDHDMGQLQVIPGSHLQGLLPFHAQIEKDYPFAIEPDYYDENDFKSIDVNPGDLLLFSAFLIHRSGENVSDKIRWTINFRYNDMAESSFIQRNYLNPFQFNVTEHLIDDFRPKSEHLKKIFQCNLIEED